MAKTLGVGIIGASAERGWAKVSHVPAVQQLRGLELAAVAAGSQPKSDAAAKAFGAKEAYADPHDLIRDPSVDIVAICVKVPDHRGLVLAALAAGRHIYCEWPLGCNPAETEELAAAARAAGVHAAIGLQARMNPATVQARDLLRSGAIGRPLSASMLSTTVAFGPRVEAAMAFGEDAANGVTLVTIQGAHTLDLAIAVLGPIAELTALATTQFPLIQVGEPPKQQVRSTPDHLLVQGHHQDGTALAMEVAGGRPPDRVPFHFEITGETGTLKLSGGSARGFQSGSLTLAVNGQPRDMPPDETGAMPETALNVAHLYAALRDDILTSSSTAPDFRHAVQLARLVDDTTRSARNGVRIAGSDWPAY